MSQKPFNRLPLSKKRPKCILNKFSKSERKQKANNKQNSPETQPNFFVRWNTRNKNFTVLCLYIFIHISKKKRYNLLKYIRNKISNLQITKAAYFSPLIVRERKISFYLSKISDFSFFFFQIQYVDLFPLFHELQTEKKSKWKIIQQIKKHVHNL